MKQSTLQKKWKTTKKDSTNRVLIAKDVLSQLAAKKINAKEGDYISVCNSDFYDAIGKQLIDILPEIQCDCCALGASMISLVRAENDFKIPIGTAYDIGKRSFEKNLLKYFDKNQLILIESAFERESFAEDFVEYNTGMVNAVRFGESFLTDLGRLKGIMNNIIKNKGTFKP